MRHTIWLSILTAVVLAAGGCKQQEPTPPAPQPTPVVAGQQDQAAKEQTHQVAAEKETAPVAAVIPAPTAPVKTVPVETAKAAPATAVKPASAPAAPVKTAPVEATKAAPAAAVQPVPAPTVPKTPAGAKTVSYKASNGTVTFEHLRHADNNSCSSCHPSDPPAKIALDKDKAHQLCKGCHQQKGSGPTQCTGCHKKE